MLAKMRVFKLGLLYFGEDIVYVYVELGNPVIFLVKVFPKTFCPPHCVTILHIVRTLVPAVPICERHMGTGQAMVRRPGYSADGYYDGGRVVE